ncbi:hypothetical protein [Variovorax sp. GB1P17]|uniref:hypothetical protein n=1 Tax=Variovorax sp. GB1P17 TaxID=3443740 RepID=UPI003F470B9D
MSAVPSNIAPRFLASELNPGIRRDRLFLMRSERERIFNFGGMSNQELLDELNFLLSRCDQRDEKQGPIREQLCEICCDLEEDEPDADAFRRYPGPATLDGKVDRP